MEKNRIEVIGGGMANLQTTSNAGLSRNTYKVILESEGILVTPPTKIDLHHKMKDKMKASIHKKLKNNSHKKVKNNMRKKLKINGHKKIKPSTRAPKFQENKPKSDISFSKLVIREPLSTESDELQTNIIDNVSTKEVQTISSTSNKSESSIENELINALFEIGRRGLRPTKKTQVEKSPLHHHKRKAHKKSKNKKRDDEESADESSDDDGKSDEIEEGSDASFDDENPTTSNNGKLTVSELISRNVILTNLISLLNKKAVAKKGLINHSAGQNETAQVDTTTKQRYLTGFGLGSGIVFIFLLFSSVLYWMGYKRGKHLVSAKDDDVGERLLSREKEGVVHGAPLPITEDSNDIKSLKQIVCKASIMNAKVPAKEPIGVLKRRVVAGENVRSDRIMPKFRGQSNHSNFFDVHPSQLTRKQFKERKTDSYYDDFSEQSSYQGVFDKNNKPILEVLHDEDYVQESSNKNSNAGRKPSRLSNLRN
ncbi:hypothetical protein CDAR_245501 [Caerostris darwini]|uniref:Uncharacterized protein n=1 Tax=Caerostris darwini TaxID=1538125 RepID=A0AAV4NXY8_9ARAC|nr:uncharacterized protein CDAR_245181 [Caerostris darwini]GIX89812.1 hypothetical protein CDAR_245501 [Caerostris darwini]